MAAMHELSIRYSRDRDDAAAIIRLELRCDIDQKVDVAEGSFDFFMSHDERQDIQWYLEEYHACPWGAYQDRAVNAEASMRRVGTRLFRAIFKTESQKSLYDRVASDLVNTSF